MELTGPVQVAGAVASVAFILLAAGLSWRRGVDVERSILWAALRAAVQLLAVGVLLTAIFTARWATIWAWVWVASMILIAAETARRRAPTIPHLRWIVLAALAASTGISLAIAFGFQIFDYAPVTVVVIAGITIGNTMPSTVLAADQVVRQLETGRGEIEAMLTLGFGGADATRAQARAASRTALIPQIERTKVVGLIALPGAMTGLLLAGVDPVDAVLVQLVVMYLVLGSVVVAALTVITASTRNALTPDLRVADWVRQLGT